MSHRDTDQPRVDRDLRDQLVRENGLTPYYINDAERQDREAAREWLNENVFDWDLPEHEIQLASERRFRRRRPLGGQVAEPTDF